MKFDALPGAPLRHEHLGEAYRLPPHINSARNRFSRKERPINTCVSFAPHIALCPVLRISYWSLLPSEQGVAIWGLPCVDNLNISKQADFGDWLALNGTEMIV